MKFMKKISYFHSFVFFSNMFMVYIRLHTQSENQWMDYIFTEMYSQHHHWNWVKYVYTTNNLCETIYEVFC